MSKDQERIGEGEFGLAGKGKAEAKTLLLRCESKSKDVAEEGEDVSGNVL
jgi:hypothetical protein